MAITLRKNGKLQPFKIGDLVRWAFGPEVAPSRVMWVSKGATCRADQSIVTDAPGQSNCCSADLFTEAQ